MAWYEGKHPDLALRFARAVEATVEAIAQNPTAFARVHHGRRRAGVRRFPYGIFFEVEERRIVVIACFHAKRNPSGWRTRSR
jgi:plasmid stabilization system protein ParE